VTRWLGEQFLIRALGIIQQKKLASGRHWELMLTHRKDFRGLELTWRF